MESSEPEPCPSETPAAMATGRERARRRWVTVEPVAALAMSGSSIASSVRPFFLQSRLLESLHNITGATSSGESSNCQANITDNEGSDDELQAETSLWMLYLGCTSNLLILITSIVWGSMSDRMGRKMAMILPIVGFICQAIVYLLTIWLHLPLAFLFLGEILVGLSGGFGLLFASCISYLSEITSEKQRLLRIAVADMIIFTVTGVTTVVTGVLINDVGFIPPLAIGIGFNILCFLYVAIPYLLIETVDRSSVPENRRGLREVLRSVKGLFEYNEDGRRWQMILLDLFLFFIPLNVFGTMSFFVLYGLARPFCWTPVDAALAGAFGFITASLGMVLGTKLLSICLGEYWIMQISCLSLLLFNVVASVAQSTFVIYLANFFGALRGMGIPVSRAILSKISRPEELGVVFAVVALVEHIAGFVANLMGLSIYAATVSYMPPLTFYVFIGLNFIPAGIVLILQLFWRPRRNSYQQFDGEECNESDRTEKELSIEFSSPVEK